MYNQRVERSAGYAGILFVIVVLLAVLLPGMPPPSEATPADIGAYMSAHRSMWLFANWLAFPGVVLFLWFAVQLRAYLRLAPQIDDGLPTYAFAAAVTTVAVELAWSALAMTVAFHPAAVLGDNVVRMLYDAYNLVGAMFTAPLVAMMFAVSHSGRRHGSLPAGLVWWGYLSALLMAVSTLSVFFTTGFLALAGLGALVIGVVPFAIWTIWVSVVLIRAPRGVPGDAVVVRATEVDVVAGPV
ncbi:MAG TPA: hypothetical protein VFB22_07870 [Candidatus Baltobacteraceae bacterium]|nr:hypothetical protein [Candidatus Baltobacteraceae bacterium]